MTAHPFSDDDADDTTKPAKKVCKKKAKQADGGEDVPSKKGAAKGSFQIVWGPITCFWCTLLRKLVATVWPGMCNL